MRLILLCCLLSSTFSLLSQNVELAVCKLRIDASIPFYTINHLRYYQGRWSSAVNEKHSQNEALVHLSSGSTFSLLDGEISPHSTNNQSLKEHFDVYIKRVYRKNMGDNVELAVLLKPKDWEEQKKRLKKEIEDQLKLRFRAYKPIVKIRESNDREKRMLTIELKSLTGGDEFETTEAQRARVATMRKEMKSKFEYFANSKFNEYLRNIQRTMIEPYRDAIRAEHNVQKIHTISMDIKKLGSYNADKQQFSDVWVSGDWSLRSLNVPVEYAKALRAAPTAYQIHYLVFEGNMSHPWCPAFSFPSFGFYEIVHKSTQKLLTRAKASFKRPIHGKYHLYTLEFPSF